VGLTVCLWAVWRMGRDVLPPRDALLGVLLLDGIFFYNYNSPKFNHDALQLPLWALIGFFAWRASTRGRLGSWLALGLVAGPGFSGSGARARAVLRRPRPSSVRSS